LLPHGTVDARKTGPQDASDVHGWWSKGVARGAAHPGRTVRDGLFLTGVLPSNALWVQNRCVTRIAFMDLRRFQHVVTLAEEGNFRRAAERVHLSQPAFSRSIQAAEGELGLPLFDRGATEARCTPAGAFF